MSPQSRDRRALYPPFPEGSASFHFVLESIRTLSAQNAPKKGPIKGLLSVPSPSSTDPCSNITAPFIPSNVSRYEDVVSFGYPSIGLAPWVTPTCSQSFLDVSRRVGIEALVFLLPASGDRKPPPPADATWLLSGESSWESRITYPVYAIPGAAGITLMAHLSLYSKNGTLPHGQRNESAESSQSGQRNTRLFTLIDLEKSGRKAPSIWGFLLAIIGTIVVICFILLLLYQLVQRRRREDMQRRLEAGQADYPQFDLQHIKVPRDFLARFPVYVYSASGAIGEACSKQKPYDKDGPDQAAKTQSVETTQPDTEKALETGAYTARSSSSTQIEDASVTEQNQNPESANAMIEIFLWRAGSSEPFPDPGNSAVSASKHTNRLSLSQTTCAICLDDFIPASSIVRELPCGHIYHPECIDASLTRSSSLCPLCKKSVLGPEFYPISAPQVVYQNSRRVS
ncbi:RING-H2 finger protein [Aspergillus undulatus]|uniref:RING-H2 finger protein n=1 Tax=Aspergillus undulatus TaxID=1810928 RepID=UPI003CCE0AD7